MKPTFKTPNIVQTGTTGVGPGAAQTEAEKAAHRKKEQEKALLQRLESEDVSAYEDQSPLIRQAASQGISVEDLIRENPELEENQELLNQVISQQLQNVQLRGRAETGYSPELDQNARAQLGQIMSLLNQLQAGGNLEQQVEGSGLMQMLENLSPAQQSTLYGLLAVSNQQQQAKNLSPAPKTADVDTDVSSLAAAAPQSDSSTPVAAGSSSSAATQKLLDSGEQLFNDQKYKEAYAAFGKALQQEPTLATSWPSISYYLGVSAEYSGDDTLLAQAKTNYENFLKAPGIDEQAKTWVQNELQGGLASQIALQSANAAFQKNDYDGAFKDYQSAYKADPTLGQRWPTIFYQLGVTSEYSKNQDVNKQALGFYEQYLTSPNPDPQTLAWVKGETQWLKDQPEASALVQKAQDELYKENMAPRAFSVLKGALDRFPELGDRQPDVYYSLALYAYSSADVSNAKKYLALADSAMQKQLQSDPNSEYAKYYAEQIKSLQDQINDPVGNWTTTASSWLGDKLGGREFWQELLQGASNMWINKGRLWSYDKVIRDFGQAGAHWDSKTGGTGLVRMDSVKQKEEFETLNAQVADAKQQAQDAKKELEKLTKQKSEISEQIEKAMSNDDHDKVSELNEKLPELNRQISQAESQSNHLAQLAQTYEQSRKEFVDSFKGKSYGTDRVTDRQLHPQEQGELYNWDRAIREDTHHTLAQKGQLDSAQQQVNDLQKALAQKPDNKEIQKKLSEANVELEKAKKAYTDAQTSLQQAKSERDGYVNALKQGEGPAAQYSVEVWQATLSSDTIDRDNAKAALAKAQQEKRPKAEIEDLKQKLTEAEKHLKNTQASLGQAEERARALGVTVAPFSVKDQAKLDEAANKYKTLSDKVKSIVAEHDALLQKIEEAKKANKPTTDLEAQLKDTATRMRAAIAEGQKAQQEYTSLTDELKQKQKEAALAQAAQQMPQVYTAPQRRKIMEARAESVQTLEGLTKEHERLTQELKTAKSEGKPTAELQKQLDKVTKQGQEFLQSPERVSSENAYQDMMYVDAGGSGKSQKGVPTRSVTTSKDGSTRTETRTGKIGGVDYEVRGSTTVKGFGSGAQGEGTVDGAKRGGRFASMQDSAMLGPGWWGLGKTLDHQQAALFQWHLGQGADGKITNDWRGPFATTSNEDPTQQMVTIASGGTGTDKYSVGINAGVNIGNVEHRDYDMVYGGTTGAGFGIGGMIGDQTRADLIDEQAGINYSEGETTIGGEKIDNLATVSASEQGAVGVQTDADIGAGFGTQGATLGAGAGAFAGAQIGGMASGSVDGVGATAMGQAWAGVGAKVNAHATYSHGKLSLDFGAGAALGVGGYVDLNVTVDFNQIAKEFEGIYGSGKELSEEWGKKAGFAGQAAGAVVGAVEGAGKLVLDTADAAAKLVGRPSGAVGDAINGGADKLVDLAAKQGEAAKVTTQIVSDVAIKPVGDLISSVRTIDDAANKSSSEDFSDAAKSFSSGSVIKGIEQGATGAIVGAVNAVKDAAKAVFSKW